MPLASPGLQSRFGGLETPLETRASRERQDEAGRPGAGGAAADGGEASLRGAASSGESSLFSCLRLARHVPHLFRGQGAVINPRLLGFSPSHSGWQWCREAEAWGGCVQRQSLCQLWQEEERV